MFQNMQMSRWGARLVGWSVVVVAAAVTCIGAVWWVLNLDDVPEYGDTPEYFDLAERLEVDEYRTLAYPLVVRGSMRVGSLFDLDAASIIFLGQTVVAAGAAWYLIRLLSDAWQRAHPSLWAGCSRKLRGVVEVGIAAGLLMLPLVNHFNLTILPDSLALSFFVVALAGLARMIVLNDLRLSTVAITTLTFGAAAFVRWERGYVLLAVLALVALATGLWGRRAPAGTGIASRPRAMFAVCGLLAVPIGVVYLVNQATQTADYGRPSFGVAATTFDRTVWPRMEAIYPELPQDVRTVVSLEEARAFDDHNNEVLPMLARLQAADGGGNRLVWSTVQVAVAEHWPEIVRRTGWDIVKYAGAPFTHPGDLITETPTATGWTDSRMSMGHPRLTDRYLGVTFWSLFGVLVPALVAAIAIPTARRRWLVGPTALVWGLLGVAVLLNAVMYGVHAGMHAHIRYAMPSYMLVYALMLHAGLSWLTAHRSRRLQDVEDEGEKEELEAHEKGHDGEHDRTGGGDRLAERVKEHPDPESHTPRA